MRKTLWTKSLQHLLIAALLLILAACRKTPPTLTLTSPLSVLPTPAWGTCRRDPRAEWQVWQVMTQPLTGGPLVSDGVDIWFSNDAGIYRIHPETLTYAHYADVAPARILLPVGAEQLWAVTRQGVLYFDGQEWIKPALAGNPYNTTSFIQSLKIDAQGDLWIGSAGSRSWWWTHYPGHVPPATGEWPPLTADRPESWDPYACDQWQAFSDGTLTYSSSDMCRRMKAAYPDGNYNRQRIFALPESGPDRWEAGEGQLRHITPLAVTTVTLPVPRVNRMVADPVNGVWLSAPQGIFYANNEGVRHLEIPWGKDLCVLPDTPYDIAVDAAGNLWATTRSGLFQLAAEGAQWEAIYDTHVPQVDRARPPNHLAAAPDGSVWATHGWDLWQVNQMAPKTPTGIAASCAAATLLTVDPSGDVWAVSWGCGILQYRPTEDTWVVHAPEIYAEELSSGVAGIIYARGSEGVFVYRETPGSAQPAAWTPVVPEQIGAQGISAHIAADRQRGVWVWTYGNDYLWHIQDDHVLTVPLPASVSVNALYVDPQDRLWVQDWQKLYHYNGAQFTAVSPPISNIRKITVAADGRVWMIGADAIAVYNPGAAR